MEDDGFVPAYPTGHLEEAPSIPQSLHIYHNPPHLRVFPEVIQEVGHLKITFVSGMDEFPHPHPAAIPRNQKVAKGVSSLGDSCQGRGEEMLDGRGIEAGMQVKRTTYVGTYDPYPMGSSQFAMASSRARPPSMASPNPAVTMVIPLTLFSQQS